MGDLGTTVDSNILGLGINDKGQVAETAYVSASSNVQHAFLYTNGQLQDLGAFAAYAINNSGQITGSNDFASGTHAVLYSNGQKQDLGTLPGGQGSIAFAINNAGEVTGISYNSSGAVNVNHAFVYANGHIQDLGTLGGYISVGLGINDAGEIVGASSFGTEFGSVHAFTYLNGQMQDLNSLIDPALNLTLTNATAINSSGDIVADGYDNHAYSLRYQSQEPGGCCWLQR